MRVWERPAGDDDYRVPVAEVEDTIREACRRWRVVEIIADPFSGPAPCSPRSRAAPDRRVPALPFTVDRRDHRLVSAAVNGRMSHSGNAALAAHVAAAVIVEDDRGIRLSKASRSRTAQDRPRSLPGHGPQSRYLARYHEDTQEDKEFRRMNDLLTSLLQQLDEPAARYAELDLYYTGKQPLAFLSPEAKAALGTRFGRMASNIPRLAVTALAERLRVTGSPGRRVGRLAAQRPRPALRGRAPRGPAVGRLLRDRLGRPVRPAQGHRRVRETGCGADRPGYPAMTAAVKRWETKRPRRLLYLPDEIVRLRANQTGATTSRVQHDRARSPIRWGRAGRALRNADRLLDDGCLEIEDLKPLVDALNKVLTDMMVTSRIRWPPAPLGHRDRADGGAGPRRRRRPAIDAAGNPVTVEVNPIPEGSRAMISESDRPSSVSSRPRTWPDMGHPFDVMLSQIGRVHASRPLRRYPHDNPASADALRAAEAA